MKDVLNHKIYCEKENVAILFVLLSFNCFYVILSNIDFWLGLTFLIIQFMAVWSLVLDKSGLNYSLNMMHWIFVLIHYFYAPIAQVSTGRFPWKSSFTTEQLLATNALVILWCSCYKFVYSFLTRNRDDWNVADGYKMIDTSKIPNYKSEQIMFYVGLLITVFSIAKFGSSLVSSREAFDSKLAGFGQIFTLIFKTMFRAFTVTSLALLMWKDSVVRNRGYGVRTYVLLLCVLILYFPTNSGRLWILSIYMGIVLVHLFRLKHKSTLFVLMIFGVIYFAALINVFRFAASGLGDFFEAILKGLNVSDRLSNGDFDCYTMIIRTLSYVDTKGITNGRQLLGAFLFWVPRSIWPTKPVGSGSTVLAYQGSDFTNVSSPIIAEGYINFGVFGVMLFALIYAVVCCKIDYRACGFRKTGGYNSGSFGDNIQFVYGVIVGYSYLLLRGDLLTALSNLIGILMPVFFLTIINRVNIRKGTGYVQ